MSIKKLNLQFDIQRLRSEVARFLEKVPYHPVENQISLTHRPEAFLPFYDGAGSIYDREAKVPLAHEEEFTQWNRALKGSYLEEVYCRVRAETQIDGGRVRLIALAPKTCFSMHRDTDYRLHIPIFTAPQCYFVFREDRCYHLPADGHVYAANTLQFHSVMNGDSELRRTHLVFSTGVSQVEFWENLKLAAD